MFKRTLFFLFVIFAFSVLGFTQERRKPIPLKELQNPKGPSYVPIPYPQSEEEIITDYKYAIKKIFSPRKNSGTTILGLKKEDFKDPKLELLNPNSNLKIEKIIKVLNRTNNIPDDYFFVLEITDQYGNVMLRSSLHASGLYMGSVNPYGGNKIIPFKSIFEIKKQFLIFMGNTDSIESFDRIYFPCSHSNLWYPIIQIRTNNKEEYYIFESNYEIYKLIEKEKFPNKDIMIKEYGEMRERKLQLLQNRDIDIFNDIMNKQMCVLEKVGKI